MTTVLTTFWLWTKRSRNLRRWTPVALQTAHPVYRQALLGAGDGETWLTHAFSGRPARGLENRYLREMAGAEDTFPDFPILNTLTGPLRKASAEAGKGDFMSL